jgi:hypothetical protein
MRSARNYGFALGIAATATWVGVVSAAPRVEVAKAEIEFGVVAPGDPVKARFELRNTGDETLEILKADPGCACTVAEHPKTIAPGAVGYIEASLDTSKLRGEVGKGIVVDTNDPQNLKVVLTMKGLVMSSAMLLPEDKVYLDNLNESGILERRLVRGNPLDKGVLEIRGITTSAPWLDVTARKLDRPLPEEIGLPPSREGDWLLEIRVRPGEMPYGARSEKVTFDTGLVRQPKLEVPIYARLLPPVNLTSQKLVLAGDDPAKAHETLLLSVRHGLAPEDLKVEAEPAALRVELEPAGGRNYKAHVRWAGTRRENGTIRFRVGEETYPVSVEWGEATAATTTR